MKMEDSQQRDLERELLNSSKLILNAVNLLAESLQVAVLAATKPNKEKPKTETEAGFELKQHK